MILNRDRRENVVQNFPAEHYFREDMMEVPEAHRSRILSSLKGLVSGSLQDEDFLPNIWIDRLFSFLRRSDVAEINDWNGLVAALSLENVPEAEVTEHIREGHESILRTMISMVRFLENKIHAD